MGNIVSYFIAIIMIFFSGVWYAEAADLKELAEQLVNLTVKEVEEPSVVSSPDASGGAVSAGSSVLSRDTLIEKVIMVLEKEPRLLEAVERALADGVLSDEEKKELLAVLRESDSPEALTILELFSSGQGVIVPVSRNELSEHGSKGTEKEVSSAFEEAGVADMRDGEVDGTSSAVERKKALDAFQGVITKSAWASKEDDDTEGHEVEVKKDERRNAGEEGDVSQSVDMNEENEKENGTQMRDDGFQDVNLSPDLPPCLRLLDEEIGEPVGDPLIEPCQEMGVRDDTDNGDSDSNGDTVNESAPDTPRPEMRSVEDVSAEEAHRAAVDGGNNADAVEEGRVRVTPKHLLKAARQIEGAYDDWVPIVVMSDKGGAPTLKLDDGTELPIDAVRSAGEDDDAVVRGVEHDKLFGIIDMNVELEVTITPDGTVKEIHRPWYSFLLW